MTEFDEALFDECLAEWERAADAGRDLAPAELCPSANAALHAALEEAIASLKVFRGKFDTEPREVDADLSRFCADAYDGIEEIDQGGQGLVIRARDRRLERDVAVKVPKAHWAWMGAVNRRFEQEARISGSLEHPGVVPVYGFGRDANGRPYYAMRYLQKQRTLEQAIAEVHALPPGTERTIAYQGLLRQFLTVCRTIAYAHDRGVIHRDLKPANVLVGDYGEVFVVDWGLAKEFGGTADRSQSPTQAHDPTDTSAKSGTVGILGTPVFMSPEQAVDSGQVGPASDIYSLGAMLYQLLTGHPPFTREGSVATILEQVKAGKFPPPHEADPTTPRALSAVCQKAMRRDPMARYATAGDLASEIERWLADEPVKAWRDPISVRLRRWTKRHRTLVAAGVVLLLMGFVTTAVAAGLLAESNRQRATFIAELEQKNTDLADAVYRNQFFAAYASWQQGDINRAETILAECDPDRRAFEWYYLQNLCEGNAKTIWSTDNPVQAVTTSPNGKWVAAIDEGNRLHVIDVATGQPTPLPRAIRDSNWRSQPVAFSHDGSILAAIRLGQLTDEIVEWTIATGEIRVLELPVGSSLQQIPLGYRSGGSELLVMTKDPRVKPGLGTAQPRDVSVLVLERWDTTKGKWLEPCPAEVSPFLKQFGILSPDAEWVAVWSIQVEIRNCSTGEGGVLHGHKEHVNAVAFSPDNRLVATASDDTTVRVWDVATRKELFVLDTHRQSVRAVAFSPDGKLLASAGDDRCIKVWDTVSGRELMTLRGREDRINSLKFLPDGRLVSGGQSGQLQIWEVEQVGVAELDGFGVVVSLEYAPSNQQLYSVHTDDQPPFTFTLQVTDVQNPDRTTNLQVAGPVLLSPDGRTLVAAGGVTATGIEVWDRTTQKRQRIIPGVNMPFAFSPNGKRLAARSWDTKRVPRVRAGPPPKDALPEIEQEAPPEERTTLLILDIESGKTLQRLDHDCEVRAVVWHPNGRKIFVAQADGRIIVWEVQTWQISRSFDTQQHDPTRGWYAPRLAISPDGQYLATTGNDSPTATLRVWNPDTGELRWEQTGHHDAIKALAFTPDSRRLATASVDRTVRLWELSTGRELLSMPGVKNRPFELAFSPNGRQLACGCLVSNADGRILIWGN